MSQNRGYPIRIADAAGLPSGRIRPMALLVTPALPTPMLTPTIISVSGVTRDAAGNAIGGVTVHLFRTSDDTKLATAISDANGNYAITINNGYGPFYAVGYLPGAPDRAGATVNTVVAS